MSYEYSEDNSIGQTAIDLFYEQKLATTYESVCVPCLLEAWYTQEMH